MSDSKPSVLFLFEMKICFVVFQLNTNYAPSKLLLKYSSMTTAFGIKQTETKS